MGHLLYDTNLKRNKAAVMKRKQSFIDSYESNQSIVTACEHADITETTFAQWCRNDIDFKNIITNIDKKNIPKST